MVDSLEELEQDDERNGGVKAERRLTEKIAGEIVLSDDPGGTLRKWREDFGISQSELSRHLGVSSSVVSDYESGRRESPGIQVVRRIVEALIEMDREKGGETLLRYKRILGAGFTGEAVKDLRDYETPVGIDEFYETIEAKPIVREGQGNVRGHTVIDSIDAITSFSHEEFARLYGWSTQRALIFTRVTRGESPLVAIRVTNFKPRVVVLHGIDDEDVSELAPRLARIDRMDLCVTNMDLDRMIQKLSKVV